MEKIRGPVSKVHKKDIDIDAYEKNDAVILSFVFDTMHIFIRSSLCATPTECNFVGSNATTMPGGASRLIERIEQLPSLSNIVVMSLVDGIKVSGINIGDTDLTLTLKRGIHTNADQKKYSSESH